MSQFAHSDIVKSASITSTDTVVSGAVRILGAHARATGAAGTVVIRDNGAGGTVKLRIYTAGVAQNVPAEIPEPGIACATDVHATLSNVDGLTVFYTSI